MKCPSTSPNVGKDSPYAGAVANLSKAGVIKGMGQGQFQPGATVTVAELAVFLCRLDGVSVDNSTAVDGLKVDGWSTGHVAWAKEAGFIGGLGQYDAMTTRQVNGSLAAYCKAHDVETVTVDSAARGDVAVALDAIRAAD